MKRLALTILISFGLFSCTNPNQQVVEETTKVEKENYDSIKKEIFNKQLENGIPSFLKDFLPADSLLKQLNEDSWKITEISKSTNEIFKFKTRIYLISKGDISKSNFYDFYGNYDSTKKIINLDYIYSDWYPFVNQKEKVKETTEKAIPLLTAIDEIKNLSIKEIKTENLIDAEIRYKFINSGLNQTDYSISLELKDQNDKLVNLNIKIVEIEDKLEIALIKSTIDNTTKQIFINDKYKDLF